MRERRIAPTSTTCRKSQQQHEFRRRRQGVTPVGLRPFCVTPRRRHTTPQPGRGSTYRQRNAVQTKPATSRIRVFRHSPSYALTAAALPPKATLRWSRPMDPQILMLLRHWMGWLRDVFSPRTQDQMLTLLAGAILTPDAAPWPPLCGSWGWARHRSSPPITVCSTATPGRAVSWRGVCCGCWLTAWSRTAPSWLVSTTHWSAAAARGLPPRGSIATRSVPRTATSSRLPACAGCR